MPIIKHCENEYSQLYGTTTLLVGKWNGTAILQKQFVRKKKKHTFTYDPVIFTPRYSSKKNKNLYLHKDIKSAQSNYIYNS